jgi:sialic acid synthase SpsE
VADIDEAVRLLRAEKCEQFILLKCTSTYPATPENTNLLTIPHLASLHNCIVGLSDHTMGVGASVAAVALGARVIEKHFTLKRSDGGVDSAFSLEPDELRSLVVETERAFLSRGKIQYGVQASEEKSLFFKRSSYVSEDISEGQVFTEANLKIIRPGDGLSPKYMDLILGRAAKKGFKKGSPLKFEDL